MTILFPSASSGLLSKCTDNSDQGCSKRHTSGRVENTVVVEIKAVSHLEPVFTAQVVTYLRITKLHVGLILNFNAPKLIDGLKRVVL